MRQCTIRYGWFLLAIAALLAACAPKATVAPAPTQAPDAAEAPAGPTVEALLDDAEARFQEKDYPGAIKAYGAFIQAYPAHDMVPAALMKIGAAYRALGDYDNARSAYQKVAAGYPGTVFGQEARVEVLASDYYEGRFDAVIQQLDATLAAVTDPDLRLRVNLLAGDAHMAMDEPGEAVLAYARAYRQAEPGVREELRQRMNSALRLLDTDAFSRLTSRIDDPELLALVAELGRAIVYRRYTIGCLLPLSGPYHVFGNRALAGMELALAEAAERHPGVEILVRDTGGDDARAADTVTALAEAGVAAIVGPIVTADAAAGAAQSRGIPIMTLTQREGVADLGDFVFRNFITPRMQAESLVGHAIHVLGARRFAILFPEDTYGRVFMNLFWDEVIRQGATVAAVASYDTEKTDFADSIKKTVGLVHPPDGTLAPPLRPVLDAPPDRFPYADFGGDLIGLYTPLPNAFYPPLPDPRDAMATSQLWDTAVRTAAEPAAIVDFDAVFIPDAPRTAGLMIPQLAYYDISDPVLLGTNLWHSEALVDMSRDYVQGAIFPDGFFADSRRPAVRRFVAAFASIYDETPGFIEAISYDATKLLLDIVSRTDVRSRTDIRDALLKTADFPGATGMTAFDYNGEVRKSPFLITIRGARFEEVAPVDVHVDAPADTGPASTDPLEAPSQ